MLLQDEKHPAIEISLQRRCVFQSMRAHEYLNALILPPLNPVILISSNVYVAIRKDCRHLAMN